MKRAVAIGFLAAAMALAAVAQHGTAKAGEGNPNYSNDTWTGTVADVDPGTMTITLQGSNGEKFTGKLHKPLVVVDVNNKPLHGGSLGPGSKVEVFYVPKGQGFAPVNEAKTEATEQGKPAATAEAPKQQTAEDNFIYKVKLLDTGAAGEGAAQPPQQQPPK